MLDKMIDAVILVLNAIKTAYLQILPSIQMHLITNYFSLAPNQVMALQILGYGLSIYYLLKGDFIKALALIMITMMLL